MDRRDFAASVSALLALGTLGPAEAQLPQAKTPGEVPPATKPSATLTSAVFKPGAPYGSLPKRTSHRYVAGTLATGHIRLGVHETTQEVGAPHEPLDIQKHNEIYLVQQGIASVLLNGVEHRLEAGDMALICAGDAHWIKNIGSEPLMYFVLTLGPGE